MLRISYIEHKKNEEVLNMTKTRRLLFDSIRKRKAKYFGHMVRQNGLQRLLQEGRIHGKREREDQELSGQITSRNGQAISMANE